ncbi:MAG: hypothetical protein IJ733_08840, partial [Lachnospiraceae bacterium]|nr:hypothetical protein [Lachnospiraceae bacterium]
MEKRLLDTFDELKLTDRQKKLFEKVYVKRIIVSKQNKSVHVSIGADFVIPYREIKLLEHSLDHAMRRMGFRVTVSDQFSLSEQYTPEIFWKEYKESVFEILREKNALLFHMLYKGEVSVEGTQMTLRCEDDLLFRARREEISTLLSGIFKEKAGFQMEVHVEFSFEKKSGETVGYEVYRRNEQGYFSSIKVKDLYSKAPFSSEEYAELRRAEEAQAVSADGIVYGTAKDAEYAALAAAESAQRFQEMDAAAPKNGTGKRDKLSEKSTYAKENRKEKEEFGQGNSFKKNKSKWGQGPVDEECFYGRNCEGEQIRIADIIGEMPGIVI